MSKLHDLASETFNEVISYLDTREWIALWICGDKRMNWRLGKGKGVTKIKVRWSALSRCPWPSQLLELDGLQSFSLVSQSKLQRIPFSAYHLSKLSRNLKILKVADDASLEAIQELHVLRPGHFQNLETLSVKFRPLSGSIKCETIPRTVTKLNLFRRPSSTPCVIRSLSSLPQSLRKLYLFGIALENIEDAQFPPTLKSLKLEWVSLPHWPIIFHLLNPEIEKIKVTTKTEDVTLCKEDWIAMGKLSSLKRIGFPLRGPFTVEAARHLPRTLEEIYFTNVYRGSESQCLEILKSGFSPQKIRIFQGIWPDDYITESIAQNLPKSIEKLGRVRVAPENVIHLPDNINQLIVGLRGGLSDISSFPSNLRHLTLPLLPLSIIPKLPCLLESLTINKPNMAHPIEALSNLPQTLTSLDVCWTCSPETNVEVGLKSLRMNHSLTSLRLSAFEENGKMRSFSVSSHSSDHLPRGLESLDLRCMDFSQSNMAEWILGLPKGLSYLNMAVNDLQLGAFSSFRALPSLDCLTLVVQDRPKGGWARYLDFASLPRKLTMLSITQSTTYDQEPVTNLASFGAFKSSADITNDTFKGSPLNLTSLTIPASPLINEGCLVHLPKIDIIWEGHRIPPWFKEIDKLNEGQTPPRKTKLHIFIFAVLIISLLGWWFGQDIERK